MKKRLLIVSLAVLTLILLTAGLASAIVLRAGNYASVATAQSPTPGAPRLIFTGFWGNVSESAAVLKSSDGGTTWTPVLAGKAASLAADPLTAGVVYAATETGLYKSVDYGNNWTLLNANVKTWVIVNAGNPLIVYGDNQRSLDGGQTWSVMTGLPAFTVN